MSRTFWTRNDIDLTLSFHGTFRPVLIILFAEIYAQCDKFFLYLRLRTFSVRKKNYVLVYSDATKSYFLILKY